MGVGGQSKREEDGPVLRGAAIGRCVWQACRGVFVNDSF